VGEIIAVGAASIVNAPLPLLPLQILYLNAINDVFPALALGVGEGEPALMERPPRNPQAGILTKRYWWAISAYGVLIAATTVGAFAIAWYSPNIEVQQLDPSQQGMEANKAITISFLTLAFGRLWHVFNMRDNSSGLFRNEITKNPYIWGALLISIGLLLCAVYVPGLSDVLKTVPPGLNGWIVILGMSFVPLVIGQIAKVIIGDRGQKKSSQQSG
jgi:Ca2+-transporting ATPase